MGALGGRLVVLACLLPTICCRGRLPVRRLTVLRGGGEGEEDEARKKRHRALGVCYYPEHWPEEVWETDAKQMSEAGIEYVRIGEFMWSLIEPSPGVWEWGLLDRAVEVLSKHGLKVVIGTPTACPPKWLVDQDPSILPYGAEYGKHPAVVGWQLDNEYGCHDTIRTYDPSARQAFREWLRRKYKNVDALNEAWGTRFWSMEYRAFEEVDLPDKTVVTEACPIHRLDFFRFSSDQVVSYNALQVSCVSQRSPGRFITHNFMMMFYDFDAWSVASSLSFCTYDSYPLGFTDTTLGLSDVFTPDQKVRFGKTGHPDLAAFHHDLHRCMSRNKRFWIMEQQPGPVNWAGHNPAPAPGMVRLWTWEAFAHGASVVSYFRWRQAPFAQEQMHAGLNRPDFTPDVGLIEARQVAAEVRRLEEAVAGRGGGGEGGSWERRAALVLDFEAHWVSAIQPQGLGWNFPGLVLTFYSALRKLGFDVDVLPPGAPLAGYALACFPSLPVVSDAAVEAAAGAGCPVIFGPRSGSKTQGFSVPRELSPGRLQALVPIKVSRVESFREGHTEKVTLLHGGQEGFSGDTGVWREWIEPTSGELWSQALGPGLRAQATAEYADGAMAAVRYQNTHYLGFWPTRELLVSYIDSVLSASGARPNSFGALADCVRVSRHDGVAVCVNYGGEPQRAPAPPGAEFLLGGEMVGAHGVCAWVCPNTPGGPAGS